MMHLGWILGALGLAGSGIGIAALLGGGPAMLVALTTARAFVKQVPLKAWYALAIAVALIAAFFVHQHFAGKALKAADAGGYARAKSEDAKVAERIRVQALAVRASAEQLGIQISSALKEQHNAKVDSVHADVADVVRLGPGKASCGRLDRPAAPALSRGQEPGSGTGTAPLDQVPGGGGAALIALPFDDAVRLAGQCDINRDEVLKARTGDDQQRAAWEKMRADLAKSEGAKP